jgi:transposase
MPGQELVEAGDRMIGDAWARQLLARRPTRIVTVALANKAARIIWALLARGGVYQPTLAQAA